MSRDVELSRYTEDELIALNRRIVERLKLLRQARTYDAMARFELGDSVTFTPECGHVVVGTVVRLNTKTITVAAKDGHQWRVAPSFLSRVTNADNPSDGTQPTLVSIHNGAGSRRR
ncbi:MAG: hypothetical protein V3T05_04795 [Myxococcota bacterium]